MRPVLFEWHGVRVYSYPVMVYLGMTFTIVVGNYMANLAGMDSRRVFIVMVLLTIPGLVGARLLFVMTHWAMYCREPRRIWRRSEGGGAMQGGLSLAVLVSAPLLAAIQVPFGAFWDVATFGMLIWLIFARIGCLLHGCCCGRITEGWFALYVRNHRRVEYRRIPTQPLESGLAALILIGTIWLWNHRPFSGAVFLVALGVYALGRFVLQPTREARDWFGVVDVQQAFSAALGALALAAFLVKLTQ